MHKYYRFWKMYYFTCDGGINPGHHQPTNVSIHESEDGTCNIWPGSVRDSEVYFSYDAALETLKNKYDSVLYNGHSVITNYQPSKVIQIK